MCSSMFMLTFCISICLFLADFAASDEPEDESERHAVRCAADGLEEWSYRGDNGPNDWPEIYPSCHGIRQSPISIDSNTAVQDRRLPKMSFYYSFPVRNALVVNTGRTIQVTPGDNNWRGIYLFNRFYRLRDIEFHWGSSDKQGSEHILDGVQYPMEMHLIHRDDNNVTVIVAVLFQEYKTINSELQHIVNALPKVMYKGAETRLHYRFDVPNVLPENPASYFLYEGSLTTPECTEGITWAVLKSPNHVGCSQMAEFRNVFSSPQHMAEDGCRVSDNFRPVQHMHRRTVLSSC